MNIKSMRHVMFSLFVTVALLVGTMSASAQVCPPGLVGDDCALVESAVDNTNSATSFFLEFAMDVNIDMGFLPISINVEGSGPVVLDGEGNIIAARLDMPVASADMSFFMQGAGAASFVLLDDILYFGAGDTLDDLEWRQVAAEEVDGLDTSFLAMTEGIQLADMAGSIDVPTVWTRVDGATTSTGASAVQFFTEATDVDMMEGLDDAADALDESGMGDMFGDLFDGMAGSADVSTSIFIDPDTELLLEFVSNVSFTMSMGNMFGDMGDLGLGDMEEDDEFGDMFGDLFGGLFGEMGGFVNMSATFSDYGASFDIEAPAMADPVSATSMDSLRFFSGGIPDLLSEYYLSLAGESMFGGFDFGFDDSDFDFDFDFGGMDFGFGMDDYRAHCEGRDITQAGSISVGQSVTGNLSSGGADYWTFSGNAGQTVTIYQGSNIIDSFLELLDPSGVGIASNDDGGNGLDSLIADFELPVSGEYTIVACSFWSGDTGEYNLSLD